MTDYDAIWDAWLSTEHAGHDGWYYDHRDSVRCACGTDIPVTHADEPEEAA